MQADYALFRHIGRACRGAHPTGLPFTVLCREFPDNPARDVRYHGEILEDQGFLQIDKLRAVAADATSESVRWIPASHPSATEQFPDKAEGPTH